MGKTQIEKKQMIEETDITLKYFKITEFCDEVCDCALWPDSECEVLLRKTKEYDVIKTLL